MNYSKILNEINKKRLKTKQVLIELYKFEILDEKIIEFLELGLIGIEKRPMNHKSATTLYYQTIEEYIFEKIKNFNLIQKYKYFEYFENDNKLIIIIEPFKFEGIFLELINKESINFDYFSSNNKLLTIKPNTAGIYFAVKKSLFEYFLKNKFIGRVFILRKVNDFKNPYGANFLSKLTKKTLDNLKFESSKKEEFENFLDKNDIDYLKLKNKYFEKIYNKNLGLKKFF